MISRKIKMRQPPSGLLKIDAAGIHRLAEKMEAIRGMIDALASREGLQTRRSATAMIRNRDALGRARLPAAP
jgi:hypothetical protein